jgi:hypothetical protein
LGDWFTRTSRMISWAVLISALLTGFTVLF